MKDLALCVYLKHRRVEGLPSSIQSAGFDTLGVLNYTYSAKAFHNSNNLVKKEIRFRFWEVLRIVIGYRELDITDRLREISVV